MWMHNQIKNRNEKTVLHFFEYDEKTTEKIKQQLMQHEWIVIERTSARRTNERERTEQTSVVLGVVIRTKLDDTGERQRQGTEKKEGLIRLNMKN